MENQKEMIAALTPNDLNALSSILYFYERYLWNSVPPSAKRSRQIAEIQLLLVKMQFLASSKAAVLTFDEIELIDNAISIFTSQARQKIPQSKSRDEVLESCERLRMYISEVFVGKRA